MNVGFIGLGIMGESMCENILKRNFPTWVYDIDPTKMQKMKDLGASPCKSVADIADHANYIIIMVPNSIHVEDVINKLLPKLKPGMVIIDMSTISPTVSKRLAEQVKTRGAEMLDAPVVKSKAAAISGELGILVGGNKQIFESVKPLLECMGKNIIHLGPNGNGLIMKLAHNMLVGEIQNGVNEMLVMTQATGLNIDDVVKAISYGGGQNFYLDSKWKNLKSQDYSPKFPFEHMNKDLGLTHDFIQNLHLELPGLELIQRIYQTGMQNNLNREDFSASFKVVEQQSKSKK
jgi:3-hydroxyisobutyrate dehydrogenase-like beta-hydroxyacid dehydrogenase